MLLSEKNQCVEQCIEYIPVCFRNKDIEVIYAFYLCMKLIGSFNWKVQFSCPQIRLDPGAHRPF